MQNSLAASTWWPCPRGLDFVQTIKFCILKEFKSHIAAIDLQVHLGLRLLRWAGSFSKPIAPSNSVLAGSSYSNSYARLYLYDFFEQLHF